MNKAYYYNSRQTAALFGVSVETVRNWGYEFRDYLSPSANPGRGRHRKYNHEDLTVFSLAHELKARGMTFADVHGSLQNGQRGQPPTLDPNEVQAIVVSEQEKSLAFEVDALQRAVLSLQQQLGEAQEKLKEAEEVREQNIILETKLNERENHHDTQLTERQRHIDELGGQLKEARQRIEELLEESGKQYAKGMMEALERRGDLRPRE